MPNPYDNWDDITPLSTPYDDWQDVTPSLDNSFGAGYGLPSLGDIGTTALNSAVGFGQSIIGGLDILQAPQRKLASLAGYEMPSVSGQLHDLTGYDPGMTKKFISSYDSPELKQAKQEQAKTSGFADAATNMWRNPGLAALSIEESAPQMAAGGALGRVAKVAFPALNAAYAGALGEFATTAGSQAGQIGEEKGDFEFGDLAPTLTSSALTALISGAGGKLAEGVGLPDIDAFLADRNITGSRRIPALIAAGLIEAGEEGAQSYQEQVATNYATGKPLTEGAGAAAASGMISGGLMGGTIPAFRRGAPSQKTGDTTPPNPPGNIPVEGVFGEDEEAVGATFDIPEADATNEFIAQARDMGFERAGMLPGGRTVFRRINAPEFAEVPDTPAPPNVTPPPEVQPNNDLSLQYNARETPAQTLEIPVSELTPQIRTDLKIAGYVLTASEDGVTTWSQPTTSPTQEPYVPNDPTAHEEMWNNLPDPVGERSAEGQAAAGYGPDLVSPPFDPRQYTEEDRARMAENLRRMLPPAQSNQVEQPIPPVSEWPTTTTQTSSNDDTPAFVAYRRRRIEHLEQIMSEPSDLPLPAREKLRVELDRQRAELAAMEARMGLPSNNVTPFPTPDIDTTLGKLGVEGVRQPGHNQEDSAWEETPDDAFRGGPVGVVPRNPDVFSDEDARRIIDRAMPQPDPEPELPTEYGQNPLDEEARQWLLNQDRVIGDYQGQGGRLMDSPVREGEILPPETSTGLNKVAEQGLMPSYEQAKAELKARDARGEVVDYEEELAALSEAYGIQDTMSVESENYVDEVQRAHAEGYKVYPPGYKGDPDDPIVRTFESEGQIYRVVGYPHLVTPDNPTGQFNKQTNQLTEGNRDEPSFQRAYEDLTPDRHKRYEVYDENDTLIDKTYDYDEAHQLADRADGYVKDVGEKENFLTEMTGVPEDDFVRMEVGERTAILRNMQGSYAEHGARVANKELLQNAIDATPTGGNISVDLNYREPNGKMSITVTDEGPGLPIDLIKNEFVTLTGSGKRGQVSTTGRKTIGEMGVGKATYLLGTESFEVTTIAREPDGTVWKYEFEGDPDVMIGETADGTPVPPMKINKTRMPDNTPTGTTMKVYESDKNSMLAAEDFLKKFGEYSDSPVNVKLTGNQYDSAPGSYMAKYNLNETVTQRTSTMGQLVHAGSLKGGDYEVHVPDNAKWSDKLNNIAVILTARGMFQGVESVWVGPGNRIPDRVVLNIEPTVSAQDAKNYPFTSPTREKLKGPYKHEIEKVIQQHLVQAAKDKTKKDIKAAYDALIPAVQNGKRLNFVTNDRGGRYTPEELANFNNDPSVQGIANYIGKMLDELSQKFPFEQITKTIKHGFDLANIGAGGINIQDVANPKENAILIGFFDALSESDGDPVVAGELFAHTILHEFNHNRERTEGASFTYKLRDTDAKFGTARRGIYAKAIESLLTDGRGGFNPRILKLIQEHSAARGRQDTTIDFIARQEQGGFLTDPGSSSVPEDSEQSGNGIASIKNPYPAVKNATGWGQGPTPPAPKKKKGQPATPTPVNWVKEALAVPAGMTTTMDLSAPFRQGLSMIHTPQFWRAIGPMLKAGWSDQIFQTIDADLRSKPIMQARRNTKTGKVKPSIAQEAGLKMFETASTGNMSQRAQATASRWLEQGIGQGIGSKAWRNTVGKPIRASNRAYITFLNHLKVNRFEHLMDQSKAMAIEGISTGKARPGIFKQNFTPTEAMELNGYRNAMLAKEIADFVNTATGQGPLKTHILPFKQTELSLEKASGALQHILFSPGLIASRVRMLNPSTYIMASPTVRRQYMMSALATGTAWMSALAMIKLGGGDEVEVEMEPTSADFGKAKIGDTRMDPGGGFQQFIVAMSRMIEGGTTSSSSGQWREFGEGFNAPTQWSNLERFMSNKLNPVTKFAYDLASQSEYNPFHVYDRVAQMFVPLVIQDLIGLYKEDPELLPWMGPIMLGMGTQTYGRGESVGKLVDPENDWLASGGGIADLYKSEDQGF